MKKTKLKSQKTSQSKNAQGKSQIGRLYPLTGEIIAGGEAIEDKGWKEIAEMGKEYQRKLKEQNKK